MLSQFCFISTFGLVALICQTSLSVANHTQLNRQRHHRLARDIDLGQLQQDVENRRDDVFDITKRQVGTVTVPLADIQLLQSEITAFGQWMSAWLASQDGSTSTESISLLQQEITAYEGWMQAWLDLAGVTSASATTLLAPHTSVPLPTSVGPSSTLDRSASQHSSPTSSPVSAPSSASGGQFVQEAKTDVPTTPTTSSTRSTSSTSSAKTTATPPGVTVKTSSASTQVSSHSMVATVTSSRTASSIPTGGSSYRFNADASNNVAVYYGQTAATGQVNLTSLCEDQSVDIVILAFLTEYFGPGGYPTVNFGATCGGQSQEQQQAGASGLLSCGILASQVATCQEIGKKVLLSLGGAISTSSFNSDQQATQFAIQLWNLFGGGSNYSTGLRPFGSIKVDGFDIDNEDDSTSYYNTFATSLRSQFSGDSSKTYYISAAPQCPIPDASIPLQAMQQADFVWVQFYNNGDCNVGQSGFSASFSAWSSDLSAAGKGPKLYIGAPAWSGGGTGYLPPSEMASVIQGAKALGESNFGGVMLWDGSEAQVNGEYQQGVKSALQ